MNHLGVEIELTGITMAEAKVALENLFHSVAEDKLSSVIDMPYYYHRITDTNGDVWVVKRDRSITPQVYKRSLDKSITSSEEAFEIVDLPEDSYEYMVEVVSPVMSSQTLPILFSVVDTLKGLGGIANGSCGIHVHIDKPQTVSDMTELFYRFISEQDTLVEKFNVTSNRLEKYCRLYNEVEKIEFESEDDFLGFLLEKYGYEDADGDIVMKCLKYYALNFYAIITHGTVEYRFFNSSLEKSEVARILDWVIHFTYSVDDNRELVSVLYPMMITG